MLADLDRSLILSSSSTLVVRSVFFPSSVFLKLSFELFSNYFENISLSFLKLIIIGVIKKKEIIITLLKIVRGIDPMFLFFIKVFFFWFFLIIVKPLYLRYFFISSKERFFLIILYCNNFFNFW